MGTEFEVECLDIVFLEKTNNESFKFIFYFLQFLASGVEIDPDFEANVIVDFGIEFVDYSEAVDLYMIELGLEYSIGFGGGLSYGIEEDILIEVVEFIEGQCCYFELDFSCLLIGRVFPRGMNITFENREGVDLNLLLIFIFFGIESVESMQYNHKFPYIFIF